MEVKSKRRVFIRLPKKHMASLALTYELDHGLIIKELNPHINAGYIQAYFKEWGVVTACKVKKSTNPKDDKSVAYVRFSTEDDADKAEWASPHYIGGDVEVKRVVSPKMETSDEEESYVITRPRPRRSMGLGYLLEDTYWLDDELK